MFFKFSLDCQKKNDPHWDHASAVERTRSRYECRAGGARASLSLSANPRRGTHAKAHAHTHAPRGDLVLQNLSRFIATSLLYVLVMIEAPSLRPYDNQHTYERSDNTFLFV